MATLLEQLLSLAAAGVMMLSNSLDIAAPHNDEQSLLFLANRQWRVSSVYEPQMLRQADVPGQLRNMREAASLALEQMFADCKAETGATLQAISGYRSYWTQNTIYNNKVESVGSRTSADRSVARPGASEHQLGLAMDVGQKNKTNLSASFAKTSGGKWVQENCWRYGFIIRYGEEWEDVTGYRYEPWHVRYVGLEYARELYENPMPLETFLILKRTDLLTNLILVEK